MRHLALIPLLSLFLLSCQDEPKNPGDTHDSLPDTAGKTVRANVDTTHAADTQHVQPVHYDCSVLRRRIPNDTMEKRINRDLLEMQHCGIDSFDFLYVVPNLFPRWLSEQHVQGNDSVTYGDFLKHMNEFRMTKAYSQLHLQVQTLDSLKSVPFDARKIYSMKPVLGRLGFTEPEWQMFSGFARTYPVPKKGMFTWGDMFEAFEKYRDTAPE